jgi:hypothetical protein
LFGDGVVEPDADGGDVDGAAEDVVAFVVRVETARKARRRLMVRSTVLRCL